MQKVIFLFGFIFSALLSKAQISLEVNLINLQNNEAVPSLSVKVSRTAINFLQIKQADNNGIARFELPMAGTYAVTIVDSSRYDLLQKAQITLRSNESSSVTLLLYPITAQELSAVEITDDRYSPTKLNALNAEVSSELNSKQLTEIPVEGRDVTRSLYRLPNVVQATGFFSEAPNVAINGANALYTNYLIDGMDNNENFLGGQRFAMPIGFTENVSVLTNNFSSEFGLTANGVINITTKSGSNDFTGEAFYVVRPGPAIDGQSRFPQRDLSGNQVKNGFQRHQFGFGVGGALVKNKTFYYLNAEQTLDFKDNALRSPELGINETVTGQNTFNYLSAKIDHFWNRNFRSSLRVNSGLVDIERQGGGLEGGVTFPSAANTQERNSLNIAFTNQYQLWGATMQSNYNYGRFRWNFANPANPNDPNVTVLSSAEIPIAVLGHPGFVFDEIENSHQFQQKATWHQGRHTLKAGVEFKSSNFELFGGGNPNGSYTVKLNENQLSKLQGAGTGSALGINDIPANVEVLAYGIELRPNSFQKTQNIFSLYFEDQIALSSKLNLNLGLRYDYDNLSRGAADEGDLDNIAPRLSANYKLNPKTVLRAGYGMFYEKIIYAAYSDALQFNNNSPGYRRQIAALQSRGIIPSNVPIANMVNEGNLTASFDPNQVDYLEGPPASQLQSRRNAVFSNELRIINPNGYTNPVAHQFTLGYQKQLKKDLLFSVDLMHNRTFNLMRLRNLNAPEAYPIVYSPAFDSADVRTQAEADASRHVPVFSDSKGNYTLLQGDTIRSFARNVMMSESEGKSRFYAATFSLNKSRGEDDYAFRLTYTLSYLENNTEDINFRAADGNNFEREWGPSINDRRHILNAFYTHYPVQNLAVTVAALLQSGQPVNRVPDAGIYGTTDLNGDGNLRGSGFTGGTDRSPGEERNSDRLFWSNTFDVGAEYRIPLNGEEGKQRLIVRADVFNLFNANNLSGFSNNATQSNQEQVGPAGSGFIQRNAAPPRQFQFTLRYVF